jgi:hypothetical protein
MKNVLGLASLFALLGLCYTFAFLGFWNLGVVEALTVAKPIGLSQAFFMAVPFIGMGVRLKKNDDR